MDENLGPAALITLGFLCPALTIVIIIGVLYLLTLQRALKYCARRNRTMEPGMVWLNLIPIFNIYWNFHTVIHIARSLKNEFTDRDMDYGGDYGRSIGIAMLVLQIVSSFLTNFGDAARAPVVAFLGMGLSLVALVLLIVYWVRMFGYGTQLKDDNIRRLDRPDDFGDDDDDRNPPRPLPGPQSSDIQAKRTDERYS